MEQQQCRRCFEKDLQNDKVGRSGSLPGYVESCEFVKHLASRSCMCQMTGPDVEFNRHYKSCWVGKAQRALGRKVSEKKL